MDDIVDDEATAEARRVQDEWMKAHPPFWEQDENGIDLSLIRANLRLTPEQRFDQLQASLDFLVEFNIGTKHAAR